MSDIAIRVEGLSKLYRLGAQESYRTLRDTLTSAATAPFRHVFGSSNGNGKAPEQIWALKDVSFEVKRGEVVGIIGRNGAGKSTLLKILSRITEPTKGHAEIHGRVGSLLEVGTGFHPELTGRENIYLNGAILGMKKAEIERKFDEIVAFAEVESFVDTPAKHYSSGMYLRLAFAVAAYLEPEILIVDEVLAVGDAEFQKRCLGKMDEISKGGRTVILVSHQMAAVQSLCSSTILLRNGSLAAFETTNKVIAAYLAETVHSADVPLESRCDRRGTGAIRFTEVHLRTSGSSASDGIQGFVSGGDAVLDLHFRNCTGAPLRSLAVSVGIDSHYGHRILCLDSDWVDDVHAAVPANAKCIHVRIPSLPLAPGRYGFTLHATVGGVVADWVQNAGFFEVNAADFYGTGKLPPPDQGCLLVHHSFHVECGEPVT
jgi:lipopolysaccharide transport system ATP-binding protein